MTILALCLGAAAALFGVFFDVRNWRRDKQAPGEEASFAPSTAGPLGVVVPARPRNARRRQEMAPAPGAMLPPADAPLLVCRGVEVAYGKVRVLFRVDMEIARGEIVALLGTNGAGKSTLLKAISGLVGIIGGTVTFDGRDVTDADPVARAKLGIAQVPGHKAVFPTLTVAEHFRAASWLFSREDPADIRARADRVLTLFPRLRECWGQLAGNLSGGEQQQLGLGMTLAARPRLLIIDELSLGLAPTVVEQLLGVVREINREGCTVILVEQSVNVALTIADRAYFMEKGEVRFEGSTAGLLERGDLLRSVFLEGAAAHDKSTVIGRSHKGDTGSSPSSKSGDPAALPVALRVVGLTKSFGGISAVDDVTFDLHRRETLGLIGPNGAGKTTIFDLISGMVPADGGRIELAGVDISARTADHRAALGLGRSFQDARLFPSLTVTENLALGRERHIETRDHLAALLDLPAIQESEGQVVRTVEELLELMSLQPYRDKFVSELSTGVRRIVDLAMAIAHEPTVLLLDEPSSGIAQRETEALRVLLERIQEQTGCALLVIEHDIPLIASVSDEIVALDLGSIVTKGAPNAVLSDSRVVSSYLGGDLNVINRSGAASLSSLAVPTAPR